MSPNEAATATLLRIGEELRQCRKKRKWTLRDLSMKANVSLGYLSEIERGLKEPTLSVMTSLAQALGVEFVVRFEERNYARKSA